MRFKQTGFQVDDMKYRQLRVFIFSPVIREIPTENPRMTTSQVLMRIVRAYGRGVSMSLLQTQRRKLVGGSITKRPSATSISPTGPSHFRRLRSLWNSSLTFWSRIRNPP